MNQRNEEERARARAEREARRTAGQPELLKQPPKRQPRVRHSRKPLRISRRGATVAVVLAIPVLWFLLSLFQPFKGDGSGSVSVSIPSGASASQIGGILAKREVISSSLFFSFRATLSGKLSQLKPGSYELRRDMSYGAVLDRLSKGPRPAFVKIVIPEGKSRREIVSIVSAAGLRGSYLKATERSSYLRPREYGAPRGTRTLEGFLFPATYELSSSASVRQFVRDQLKAFKVNFTKVNMTRAKRKNLTAYDVITIASMIEREAAVARDRRRIAAVIYNRLKRGMPLGIDATTRYATNNWSKPLTGAALSSNSAYNTRRRHGLPPTPIGNPGLASLRAAANPAKVSYLYYVVRPGSCGEHSFSSTAAKFERDVAAYRRARVRAGGRSPTDCE